MAGFYGVLSSRLDPLAVVGVLPNLDGESVTAEVAGSGRFHLKHFKHSSAVTKVGISSSGETVFAYAGFIQAVQVGDLQRRADQTLSQYLAEVFERKGDALWPCLNGGWAAVVWSRRTQTLTLASDRLSSVPLYCFARCDDVAFSTSQLALVRFAEGADRLSPEGAVEFLTLGYAQADRTVIEGMRVLRGATVVAWREGVCRQSVYWAPDLTVDKSLKSPEEAADRINELLDQAVNRFAENHEVGVAISGGLDSRQIIARLKGRCRLAATFGDARNPDMAPAINLCRHMGIAHVSLDYSTEDFRRCYQRWIEINDGRIATPEYLLAEERLAQECTVCFTGGLGGALRGKTGASKAVTDAEVRRVRESVFTRENISYLPADDLPRAIGSKIPAELGDAPRRNFYAQFGAIDAPSFHARCFWHNISGRQRRRTLPGLSAGRAFLDVRTPYTDADLLKFMLRLPTDMRYGSGDAYRLALIRKYPDLAALPSNMGRNFIEEAKGGLSLRKIGQWVSHHIPETWRRRIYGCQPVRGLLDRVVGYAPPTAHWMAYRTTMAQTVHRSFKLLVDTGILAPAYATKVLRDHYERGYDHSSFFHKALSLALVIDKYGAGLP